MTKKKKTVVILGVVLILAVFAVCSTGFMFRAAVFTHSPASAVTMQYKASDAATRDRDLYVITKNAPVEKATQGTLTTWIVYHFGPLKFVKYYGEG